MLVLFQYLLTAEGPNRYDWLKSALSVEDRCVLWLAFLHIMGYKSVPHQLYDPTNQSTGKIVCKVRYRQDRCPSLTFLRSIGYELDINCPEVLLK